MAAFSKDRLVLMRDIMAGHVQSRRVPGLVMTQRVWDSPSGPAVNHDFWTSAYQAIGD